MKRPSDRFRLFTSVCAVALLAAIGSADASNLGFSISVDGQHVAGDKIAADPARAADVELARADIQVKFDGLEVKPRLNAYPASLRTLFSPGESIAFVVSANYPQWIDGAEIRIREKRSQRQVAVLPASVNGSVNWFMPPDGEGDLEFVARVYDRNGRFDETRPLDLRRTEGPISDKATVDAEPLGFDGDRTAHRGISVYGGAITVYGTNAPPGASVRVLGETVPVDSKGAFVIQRLLPAGDHVVDVAVGDGKSAMVFNRDVNIPTNDWFYVAMADLTVGTRWGAGKVVEAKPEEFDNVYVKGRTAFYLKGKIKGEYLLTASGDSGEGPVEQMFDGALTHDPRSVIRRIDPREYYPVYGDDSVMEDDAPTRGKFYVRLERGPSHVMWGTFKTVVGDSSLFRSARTLYGAAAHYESDQVTSRGQAVVSGSAYAAIPGTLSERNVFRGTGGSAYVLHRQDVSVGSETISIEVRDGTTGMLLSSKRLRPGVDYTMNYMQGLVILTDPLVSTTASGAAVRSDVGDVVELVVQYEYTPTGERPDDYALGADGHIWLGDNVRIGGLAVSEKGQSSDSTLIGVNARMEKSERTYIEGEVLASEGTSVRGFVSPDGGFTFVQQPATGSGKPAFAYRLHAQAALDEFFEGGLKGAVGGTLEVKEAGFSTPHHQVQRDQVAVRLFADVELSEQTGLSSSFRYLTQQAYAHRYDAAGEVRHKFDDQWEVSFGGRYVDQSKPSGTPEENGRRADVGGRVTYHATDDLSVYAFGQATAWKDGGIQRNDRVGGGADWQVNEYWSLSGEGSYGTSGPAGQVLLTHKPNAEERTYIGVRMAERDALQETLGTAKPIDGLVVGADRRLSETVTVRAENTHNVFSSNPSRSGIYGITVTPDEAWRITGLFENGRIAEESGTTFDRNALSIGATYEYEKVKLHGRGELRLENSDDGSRNRQTYLFQAGANYQTNDDWRLMASVDGLFSKSDQSSLLNGDYVEGTIGAAYRPGEHERLNALVRYTYLYDLPGPQQVASSGSAMAPAQRSHIFSVDANYDLNEYRTIGGKYGFRIGEVSQTRGVDDFVRSSAHLGIVRADLMVVRNWSLLLEGRAMYLPEHGELDFGALAAISRHINDNLRVGVGYNFGRFSDDLRDLRYDHQGVFLNVTAKY